MWLLGEAILPQMGNIGPPTPRGVETVFLLQLGTADQSPKLQEAVLQAGGWFGAQVMSRSKCQYFLACRASEGRITARDDSMSVL
jgi:hypothetical protein